MPMRRPRQRPRVTLKSSETPPSGARRAHVAHARATRCARLRTLRARARARRRATLGAWSHRLPVRAARTPRARNPPRTCAGIARAPPRAEERSARGVRATRARAVSADVRGGLHTRANAACALPRATVGGGSELRTPRATVAAIFASAPLLLGVEEEHIYTDACCVIPRLPDMHPGVRLIKLLHIGTPWRPQRKTCFGGLEGR